MHEEIAIQVERLCSRITLDRQLAHELADLVVAALGREFFETPKLARDPITGERTLAHPLLRTIGLSSDTPELGVGELLELGLYLRAFALDPSINCILANLRTAREYDSTLFHLAIAYRLHCAGCAPTLEPRTDRGRADIQFNFEDRIYVAECYRMRQSFFEHVGEFESALANRLFDKTPQGKRYRFTIDINSPLTYDGMRRLLRKADDLILLFHTRGDVKLIQRHDSHLLGVEDITNVNPDPDYDDDPDVSPRALGANEADLIICRSSLVAGNVFEVAYDVSRRMTRHSRALIRRGYERHWPKDPYLILEGKLGHKLKQTKVAEAGYGRMLFVQFPWGLNLDRTGTVGAHKRLQAGFVRNFPEVGAVMLLERRPSASHFGYHGPALLGSEEVAIPNSLIDRLNQIEIAGLFNTGLSS